MPAPFNASSTLPIAALLASEASRAVFASVLTPASICARSGGTDTDASPVTEIVGGGVSSASAGAISNPPASAARIRSGARSIRHACDRIGNRDGPFCHVRMQPLHHLTVQLNRPARGILRPLECRDDFSCLRNLRRRRREDRIAGLDLTGMNQCLAVKTEIASLRAFFGKAIGIAEIAVRSIENVEPVQPGG